MSSQLAPARPTRKSAGRGPMLPEIQGLRAVAVLLVVLFHLWPARLPGGFIGVDVFFVISGFLISAHLLREVERTGRVRIIQFWGRRIRRLLPASLFVLAAITVATLVIGPLSAWEQVFRHVAASAVYIENWALAADAVDYWAQSEAAPPTQHYWSLSVEEQFYFVWPLVFALAAFVATRRSRSPRSAVTVAVGVLVVASFGYSLWFSATNPSVAYFSTFTRAWEFGLGAILALLGIERVRSLLAPLGRALLAWVGLAMIGVAALITRSSDAFPGVIALLPVVGTVLVILAGTSGAPVSFDRVSSWRPVRFLGDVSYSVYLWHWPLIVMLPWVWGPLTTVTKIGIIVATLVLAWLTKMLIEDPCRDARWLTARRSVPTFVAAAAVSALLVGVSVTAPPLGRDTVATRLEEANSFALTSCAGASAVGDPACDIDPPGAPVPGSDIVAQDADPVIEQCFSQDANSELIRCTFGDPDATNGRVALVGDSHAGALAPAMMRLADERGWALDVYLKPGCPWSDTRRFREDNNVVAIDNCESWRDQVSSALASAEAPYSFVVTTSYAIVGNMVEPAGEPTPFDASVRGLRETWGEFVSATSTPILVVRDNPNWDQSPVECLADSADGAACVESLDRAFSNRDPQVAAAEGMPRVALLDLTPVYCPEDVCRAAIGGTAVYRDAHHLSRSFALSLAPALEQRIDAALQSLTATEGTP